MNSDSDGEFHPVINALAELARHDSRAVVMSAIAWHDAKRNYFTQETLKSLW